MKTIVLRLASLAAIILYFSLAAHQLGLPGLYYDEALDLPPAVQLAHGWPVTLFPKDPGVNILGYTFPVMVIDYVGAVNTYLMAALFLFTGGHWVAVRWFQVAVGALIVALSFRLARHWFGPLVAVIATLLLAVNPSFIFWSRMGISVTHLMALCSLGSLLLFTQYVSRFTLYALFCGGLLLGLGVWAKFLFVWWIAALGAVYVLFGFNHWRRGPWQSWLAVGAGALVGAAPLIYYNVQTSETLTLLLNSLNNPTPNGVNNQNFLANFQARLVQFRIWLDGSYFWYNGGLHANEWALMIYGAALGVVLIFIVMGFRRGEAFGNGGSKNTKTILPNASPLQRQRALALLVILAIILVLSSFTVSGIWATHLFILFPIPQMGVALAAVWLTGLGKGEAFGKFRSQNSKTRLPNASPLRGAVMVAAVILPLTLFVLDARVAFDYHADLARTGGPGRFSAAIYDFANYLSQNNLHTPAALDWGLEKNTFVLTDGRVQPIEIFGYSPEPDEGFRERVLASLCDGCAFINVDAAYAVFPREAAFRQIVAEAGYRVADDETMIFRERSGQPAFYIYRVRPAP
jgi:hypothetical protein